MAPRKTATATPAPVETVPVVPPTTEETADKVVIENVDKFSLVIEKLTSFALESKELISIVKALQKESKKTRGRRASAPVDPNAKRSPSGFAKPTLLSDELADFMGIEHGSTKARTEVTRFINDYIKTQKLQDENDKRIIHPNPEFKKLLNLADGEDTSFFKLQAKIKHHFKPTPPVSAPAAVTA